MPLDRGEIPAKEGGCASTFQPEGKTGGNKEPVISRGPKQRHIWWPWQERVMRAGRPSFGRAFFVSHSWEFGLYFVGSEEPS